MQNDPAKRDKMQNEGNSELILALANFKFWYIWWCPNLAFKGENKGVLRFHSGRPEQRRMGVAQYQSWAYSGL